MSYQSDYNGHCLTCANYNPTTSWGDIHSEKGFWCSKHGWSDPYDKCGSYSKSYNSDGFLESCMRELAKKKSYYIVTVCTTIMRMPITNEYLLNFEKIEKDYLEKTYDGQKLLYEYGYYGDKVADQISLSYLNNPKATREMVETTLMPKIEKMNNLFKAGKVKETIMLYIVFVRRLMQKYGISMSNDVFFNPDEKLDKSIVYETQNKFQRVLSK